FVGAHTSVPERIRVHCLDELAGKIREPGLLVRREALSFDLVELCAGRIDQQHVSLVQPSDRHIFDASASEPLGEHADALNERAGYWRGVVSGSPVMAVPIALVDQQTMSDGAVQFVFD